jgi:type I restriction enzyme R subunit
MYVDKTLTGLAAVQTLSRLNRTTRQDRHVRARLPQLAEDIQESFEPWYAQTVAPPTDPHLLYDTHAELGPFGRAHLRRGRDVRRLLLQDPEKNHARINASSHPPSIDSTPSTTRQQDEFRDVITRFVRIYSFLSQVVSFTDVKLERDYLYCRALSRLLARPESVEGARHRRLDRTHPLRHRGDLHRRRHPRR